MTTEPAIRVEWLSKRYTIGARQQRMTFRETLTDAVAAPFRRLRRFGEVSDRPEDAIWALKDVSFDVQCGEVVGIIGSNGAGKSTLLKILSQITYQTEGRVELRGRVGSLLEVGTGFHRELTGRENIFLNGAILGMKRAEVRRKFDEIVEFSGVDKFIDTPVKRYSSGMYVRLAFAVAAHLEPEILLVDEVLSVGDIAFQRKCLGKLGDVARSGRTILFVSHNLGAIGNLCGRSILLQDGCISADGASPDVISQYVESVLPRQRGGECRIEENSELPSQILGVAVVDQHGSLVSSVELWEQVCVRLDYVVRSRLVGTNLVVAVGRDGQTVFNSFDTDLSPEFFERRDAGRYRALVPLPKGLLKPGTYSVSAGTGFTSKSRIDFHQDVVSFEVVAHDVDITHKSYSRSAEVMVQLRWEIEQLKGGGMSVMCKPTVNKNASEVL